MKNIKIHIAKFVMIFAFNVAKWAERWMTSLIRSRSPVEVKKMEEQKGLR